MNRPVEGLDGAANAFAENTSNPEDLRHNPALWNLSVGLYAMCLALRSELSEVRAQLARIEDKLSARP
jgi:hypothetical protein